jgi:hypothetical protein
LTSEPIGINFFDHVSLNTKYDKCTFVIKPKQKVKGKDKRLVGNYNKPRNPRDIIFLDFNNCKLDSNDNVIKIPRYKQL